MELGFSKLQIVIDGLGSGDVSMNLTTLEGGMRMELQ